MKTRFIAEKFFNDSELDLIGIFGGHSKKFQVGISLNN